MYTKDIFSLPSLNAMCDFVRTKSFGVLATYHEGEVFTSPLPLDLRGINNADMFVAGHVARANGMANAFVPGTPATITVLGPDTYVPAEWFEVRNRIPTWLYCAVEISGRLELSDSTQTRDDVTELVHRLQKCTIEGSTWSLGEMPEHLVSEYLKHIVGFRLHDLRFKSCFRLNQGKGNTESLAASLNATGEPACRELAKLVLHPPTASTM